MDVSFVETTLHSAHHGVSIAITLAGMLPEKGKCEAEDWSVLYAVWTQRKKLRGREENPTGELPGR